MVGKKYIIINMLDRYYLPNDNITIKHMNLILPKPSHNLLKQKKGEYINSPFFY